MRNWARRTWFGRICRLLIGLLLFQHIQPTLVALRLRLTFGAHAANAQGIAALAPLIAVGKRVDPLTFAQVQDGQVTITYTVFNLQTTPAQNILLDTQLASGMTFVAGSPQPDQGGQLLQWSLGDLAALGSVTVQVTIQLPANFQPPLNTLVALDGGAHVFASIDGVAGRAQAGVASLRTDTVPADSLVSTPDADLSDPFIQAQAAQLGNDQTRIVNFMINEIGYESYTGSLRGARGTLWSKSGNSLDRATLLIALLRVSGIPCRYARGTLDDPTAKQLIGSMFPPQYQVVGFVPPGTAIADPANDPKLLGETRDHFWVQVTGFGFSFGDVDTAIKGHPSLTTATQTFNEIPDELRHKVTVQVNAEITTPLTGPGADLQRRSARR